MMTWGVFVISIISSWWLILILLLLISWKHHQSIVPISFSNRGWWEIQYRRDPNWLKLERSDEFTESFQRSDPACDQSWEDSGYFERERWQNMEDNNVTRVECRDTTTCTAMSWQPEIINRTRKTLQMLVLPVRCEAQLQCWRGIISAGRVELGGHSKRLWNVPL